jgi:hypothetical protein
MPAGHVEGERVGKEVHDFSSWMFWSSVMANPIRRFGVVSGGGSIILRRTSAMAFICVS